jgi:hypothetical protein
MCVCVSGERERERLQSFATCDREIPIVNKLSSILRFSMTPESTYEFIKSYPWICHEATARSR